MYIPSQPIRTKVETLRQEGAVSTLIVTSLPLLVFAILSLCNWDYEAILFTGDRNWVVVVAVGLIIANAFVMLRMSHATSEEEAVYKTERLGPSLTIPMILFILPCMFILVVGPAFFQVYDKPQAQGSGQVVSGPNDVSSCILTGTYRIIELTADGYAKIVSECGSAFKK
jgi:hypothetical protein